MFANTINALCLLPHSLVEHLTSSHYPPNYHLYLQRPPNGLSSRYISPAHHHDHHDPDHDHDHHLHHPHHPYHIFIIIIIVIVIALSLPLIDSPLQAHRPLPDPRQGMHQSASTSTRVPVSVPECQYQYQSTGTSARLPLPVPECQYQYWSTGACTRVQLKEPVLVPECQYQYWSTGSSTIVQLKKIVPEPECQGKYQQSTITGTRVLLPEIVSEYKYHYRLLFRWLGCHYLIS